MSSTSDALSALRPKEVALPWPTTPALPVEQQSRDIRRVRTAAGATVAAIGLVALVGWGIDSDALKALVPGSVAMKVNTSIAFLAFGSALVVLGARGPGSRARAVAYALVALTAGLAAITGIQYVLGVDIGIDHLVVREQPGAAATVHPGRMSPFTTVAFTALAMAVVLARMGKGIPVLVLVIATQAMAALNLLDKIFNATVPTFLAGYTQMAMNTAIALLVLSLGVLTLLPDGGPLARLLSGRPTAMLTRRLAMAAVAIPVVLAWVRLRGEEIGLYDTAYGLSLYVVATIFLFLIVTWTTVAALDRLDARRRAAEQAMRESEQRLQSILDNAPSVIFIKDADGRYMFVNRTYERLLHVDRSTFVGRSDRDLFEPQVAAVMAQNDDLVIEHNRAVEIEEDVPVDGVLRTFLSVKFPLHDLRGRAYGVCGIATDISGRKAAEQRLEGLSRELIRSNRELEEFAAVASHDLQEPLRKIRAFGDRLSARLAESDADEEALDDLQRMIAAAARMSRLIHDLLAYARVSSQPREMERVDLSEVVNDVVIDLEARIEATGARVEYGDLPVVTGDASQLRQLFLNLVGNALKFVAPERPPVVRISARSNADEHAGLDPEGTCLEIDVADNGVGFDEKYADRLFSPFQRLHGRSEYEGTGMGLAICRKIAERHGGTISVRSVLGTGTTFTVALAETPPPSVEPALSLVTADR